MVLQTKPHKPKKEVTRSISYRISEKAIQELETEATNKGISQNVLVNQIIDQYIRWGRFASKIPMIPVPAQLLVKMGHNIEGPYLFEIIDELKSVIKESVLFMKGGYDLKRCIESLEDYMRASGMKSDHRIEGSVHQFIIQHELGIKWSIFAEYLLKEIFHGFLPKQNITFHTTDRTVIGTINLGSDWNEHDY
jgi:hypothetical protein